MAHTCPECGMLCRCNGDIDDIDFGEDYDCICSINNEQCDGYIYEDEDDDDYYGNEEPEYYA